MIARAYRMADAVRAAGVKVVMGGPHIAEMADESSMALWFVPPHLSCYPRARTSRWPSLCHSRASRILYRM